MADITKDIEALVGPSLAEAGVELVDLEWRRESAGWVLRFTLDMAGGITLDDCAAWGRRMGEAIETAGTISHAYSLEVSSPGISRPLTKRAHFEKFLGSSCILKTKEPRNNQRNFRGIMTSLEGDVLMLLDRTSGQVGIPLGEILQAKLDADI